MPLQCPPEASIFITPHYQKDEDRTNNIRMSFGVSLNIISDKWAWNANFGHGQAGEHVRVHGNLPRLDCDICRVQVDIMTQRCC